ncbi:uncharacterized protein LOC106092931 isoform X1 [Stomoxys calcitrans]|uniref:uncharacterized protein LOC106092931 isoform X1 n=1 Tax=Stomoxys calcitrans TaxID=35570 RepID=UPI0027E3A410|nr:uncharacterized protein LOC106092931 isoform X1 [Stomoxys calcitrans]XP_059218314.1 uncharacterized protein LOC106092931 isoform X1 [Stomoxys calcitrans]
MLDHNHREQDNNTANMANKKHKVLPIEILANAKVENSHHYTPQQKKEAKSSPQKSNKTKTILSWLKNSTGNSSNNQTNANHFATAAAKQRSTASNNDINSCQRHNQLSKVNEPQSQQQPVTDSCETCRHRTAETLPKACATDGCTCPLLKHSRHYAQHHKTLIACSPPAASAGAPPLSPALLARRLQHKDETLREFRGVQTLRHLWNRRITANKESALKAKIYKQQKNFSKSQNCLLISGSEAEPLADSVTRSKPSEGFSSGRQVRAQSLHDCSLKTPVSEIEVFDLSELEIQKHLEKDNFYKYKTAEQASKLRELSEQHLAARRFSAGLLLQTTERLAWLKRAEMLGRSKTEDKLDNMTIMQQEKHSRQSCIVSEPVDMVINDNEDSPRPPHTLPPPLPMSELPSEALPRASSQDDFQGLCQNTTSLRSSSATNCSIESSAKLNRRDSLLHSDDGVVSRNSSTTSLANSSGRAAVRKNSSKRSCSFKIHARSNHARRKMLTTSKENSIQSSMVAKLTQQFNEIIINDATLLEELKRKNGVLMTHKGHVYKVVDTSKHTALTKTSSLGKATNTGNDSAVQKTIKIFENVSRASAKPKIPLKTPRVLEKSNELVTTIEGKAIHPSRLKAVPSAKQATMEARKDMKAIAAHNLSLALTTLEMVKEESKTPLEQNDFVAGIEAKQQKASDLAALETWENPEQLDASEKSQTPKHNSPVIRPKTKGLISQTSINSQDNIIPCPIDAGPAQEIQVKTSKVYRKVSRKSSLVLPDANRDILLYINKDSKSKHGTLERMKQSKSVPPESTEFSPTNVDKSCTELSSTLEHAAPKSDRSKNAKVNTLPYKPTDLQIELAKEVREKLNTLPRFANASRALIDHEIQVEEPQESPGKEKISSSDELACQREDNRKTKNKTSKFYEKINFFSLSRRSKSKTSLTLASLPTTSPGNNEIPQNQELKVATLKGDSELGVNPLPHYTPMSSPMAKQRSLAGEVEYSPMIAPEASALMEAYQKVQEKIENLSHKQEQPRQGEESKQSEEPEVSLNSPKLAADSDDYGQHLKPNSSFIHQSYSSVLPQPAQLIQAVNVTLVNAIEGEQMIMEQKEIQQIAAETKEQAITNTNEEPLYEPIAFDDGSITMQEETDTALCNEHVKATPQPLAQEEDIYQSVDELVKEVYEKTTLNENQQPQDKPPVPAQSLLDDYEIIGTPPQDHSPHSTPFFDGYEEYAPSLVETITSNTQINTFTLVMRKTTDELPDLPKPKRILPKSPMPPRKMLSKTLEINHYQCPKPPSHYYPDVEENIYDTIKGSDCYETVVHHPTIGHKLEKSSSSSNSTKNCDTISNCYESISHYKNTRPPSHHSSSSHGSNLTISSENRTNSLYEDSLATTSRYGSKRMYRRHTEAHIKMPDELLAKLNGTHNNSTNNSSSVSSTYNSSLGGRASDISDEWTDISDNEHDGEDVKPQFQIVCEKAHKSPDWSRRVRDKRLHHQRKSRSYIEDDDPDHHYEQLSPGSLSKRHSLALQERSGSLQRNQNMVRVSKRGKQISYSAHALGQDISDDSFDSDTDDYYEHEHQAHNDSGVDIRTSKLPEPPASSNQMYSFVKKFKNFLAKKSPNNSKHGGSQMKIDDSSSQFYVNTNAPMVGSEVNGEQQGNKTPTSLQVAQTKELSTSEKNLIMAQSNVTKAEQMNAATTPRKPKAGKSLRHRLRKSLVGFDSKQLAPLTPTRSTFYLEEPHQADGDMNGQMDSGFSEKVTSTEASSNTADSQKFLTTRKSKKESKSMASSQRRRTTIGIRPIEPPPPPPDNGGSGKRQSNTSWYAECGVFKNGTTNLVHDDTQLMNGQNENSNNTTSGTSWYEEAGLYQTSGISVASSSGSSGVSTSNEASPADEMAHGLFSNEPLYQIYSAAKLEAISRDMHDESSTDGYEEIGDRRRNTQGDGQESNRKSTRPTALQLVEPKSGPERTLWSQIPEVVNSMILPTLTPRERSLMEAKFEIITSEASYLKSLNLLRNHYMNHPVFRDQHLVNSRDRKALFAHIVPVHECSERLLSELESCWQDNIMLIGLSKRIYAIAEKYFHVYIGFCEHQGRMDRTLKQLRASKGLFSQNLELLESSPLCCGLNLHSFLMLPMQRITRLPLLIDAVFSKCHPNDDEYENWKMCLAIMNKIVTQCNEAATKSDQSYEIEKISRQLEFNPSVIRPLAIAPAGVMAPGTKPRFLVKKGEFTHLIWRGDDAKLTFGKKFSKVTIYAFLFSDLLVLTKRKGEEQFSVFDYCPRNMLTITSGDSLPQVPTKDLNSQTSKNLILMTLLENHQRKTSELLLSCPSVSEQERWLQAMRPPESETPGEKLYEQWDCPQVIAKHSYENNEPDGLSLEVGDVVNVTRKLPDGWYQGERIRDGAIGWFPGDYTEEVNSAHVRARNLKLRHRLLTFTATYLESQKRNK